MTIAELKKKYKGHIFTDDQAAEIEPKFYSTPFPSFNKKTKGLPIGRLTQISAMESCGKTSLALSLVRECDGNIGFIDAEKTMDFKYAEEVLGIPKGKLIITKPFYLEEGLEMANDLMSICPFIIFDSLPAARAKSTIEKDEVGKEVIASTARVCSSYLPQMSDTMFSTGASTIMLNQLRIDPTKMGDPYIEPGGNALRFETTLGIRLAANKKDKEYDKETKEETVRGVRCKVWKNKLYIPGVETTLHYEHLRGFDRDRDIISCALTEGVLLKSGSWISYEGANIAQGDAKATLFLLDNPEVYDDIKTKLNLNI